MNNKKNKSKGRGKVTKTTQETENIAAKLDDIGMVISESLNTDESRVPEIGSESIPNAENDQLTNEIPKKPKRSKSKKKNEPVLEFKHVGEENDEIKEAVKDISKNIESISEENFQIIPCERKKKKKSKKHDEKLENVDATVVTEKEFDKEKILEQVKNDSVLVNVPILESPHKDDVPSKKKKKKKHRHDSEKSDKCDPCTLAFQKLIETSKNEIDKSNESIEVQIIKDDIPKKSSLELQEVPVANPQPQMSPEQTNPNQICEVRKAEELLLKKRNKKGKKLLPEEHNVELAITSEKLNQNVCREDILPITNLDSENTVKETSPKPKAKIVKPVQKKRQNKTENESQISINDSNLEMNTSENINSDILKAEKMLEKSKSIENKYPVDETVKEIISAQPSPGTLNTDNNDIYLTNIDMSSQSIKQKINETEDSSDILKNKQEQETSCGSNDDLGFVEVKTVKAKKKRSKNAVNSDVSQTIEQMSPETQNINQSYMENASQLKTEHAELQQIIVPDLIEYPRSTSQQYIDSNNNTLIQEIISTDELPLGSPTNEPPSIIQGSGESPEAKPSNDPIVVHVTEVESQPSTSKLYIEKCSEKINLAEKTDIKSKMIEVNRDMEELRRSIERSLAELNIIEKSDTDVEKEFEELFRHTTEHLSAKTMKEKTDDLGSSVIVSEKTCEIKDLNKISENLEPTPKVALISNDKETKQSTTEIQNVPPVCPARREKGKTKSKKKGKNEVVTTNINTNVTPGVESSSVEKGTKEKSDKSVQKSERTQEKGKQQKQGQQDSEICQNLDLSFEPIENFEDALTSSVDDLNQNYEIIVRDATQPVNSVQYHNNPKIKIFSPTEDSEKEEKHDDIREKKKKQNPVSRPKNLLGRPNIPASSNEKDFKKETSHPPNSIQAKVKIKDFVEIEKASKEKNIDNNKGLIKESNGVNSICFMKTNEDLIYKYSFRRVFLQSICHVCKKSLIQRVPCKFCSLVFYCSQKHKDEDWSHHQSLCFAVSTIAHLKEQKHIYADAQNILDHNYRALRMQTILSCEKILNRKLVPWEQEALLYPRICADVKCRQWKQGQLKDCAGCGQISYCIDHPDHLPSSHLRWCKSYALYEKLVNHQLKKGRLEPPLPTRVLNHYTIPGKINDVLGSMYEEKIDMDDIQYAALTQIATGPLTAAYSYQLHSIKLNSTCANGVKKNSTFTIHTVGADLPFEADSLSKWEKFFLHIRSDLQELRVVMVGPDINSSKLPLDLLAKIKLCENCHTNKRRVLFDFHENENYNDYYLSDDFVTPDIVCAFNPNIHRSSAFDMDMWPSTINTILKQRVPFVLTSYSIEELRRDLGKIRECATVDYNVESEIKYNPFGSVRPDRNFITDHEIPLLFKNYSFCILRGTL